MKYLLMAGGHYPAWSTPRQLTPIKGEPNIQRTIRLLREAGIDDIAITTNPELSHFYDDCDCGIMTFNDNYTAHTPGGGYWVDAFYHMKEPVCYLMGDVVFSPEAIRKIVATETDSVEFFASAPPFDYRYSKPWAEPFAFKVEDTGLFFLSIAITKRLQDAGQFNRTPIAWELWQVIRDTELNYVRFDNYTVINDYTCDIDGPEDAAMIERWVE